MHTAAKVLLIIGTIATVIGIVGFALGAGQIDDLEDSWNTFEYEGATNGTIMIEDLDGQGDVGLTFWVKGVYEDKDGDDGKGDGTWDICQTTTVTITESPDVNNSWEWAEDLDGNFYNEVQPNQRCDANDKNTNYDRDGKGLVKIGRACYGCYEGNVSFESNQKVWVTYDEKVGEEIAEEGLILVLGFALGGGGICCGVLFLIIGGIMALTMKDDKAQEMMFAPPADNLMLSAQTPVVNPNKTHMSQPDFGDKT